MRRREDKPGEEKDPGLKEPVESGRRILKNVSIVFILTFIFMSCYELLKQFLNPDISIWMSHVITIVVTSFLAVFIALIPLLGTEKVLDQLNKKQKEIKKMETAILESNKKLNMLSSITRHDILNLLTVIEAYTEMMADSEIIQKNQDYKNYINKVRESVDSMSNVIISTRDYQDLGIKEPVWIDVKDVFLKIYRENCQFHHFRAVPPEENIEVYVDSMFERVLYNLMDNTLKHSEKASYIRISFSCEDKTGSLLYEDDGRGIAEDEKEKVFNHTYGKNTGLGLFLTREILEITGIEITEEGIPGKGVCFRMAIPPGRWRSATKDGILHG